jgi:hypothetical protein
MHSIYEHLDACDSCRAYLEELERERADLGERLPSSAFTREVRKRAVGVRNTTPILRLALVGGLLLILAVSVGLWRFDLSDTTRSMGGLVLTTFLKHGDRVTQIEDRARIEAGDAVRFKLQLPQDGYLSIFFMDAAGRLSWYLPESQEDLPKSVRAGEFILEDSARFDDATDDERAFVVFRPEIYRPVELALQIQTAWKQAQRFDFGDPGWIPPVDDLKSVFFTRK